MNHHAEYFLERQMLKSCACDRIEKQAEAIKKKKADMGPPGITSLSSCSPFLSLLALSSLLSLLMKPFFNIMCTMQQNRQEFGGGNNPRSELVCCNTLEIFVWSSLGYSEL